VGPPANPNYDGWFDDVSNYDGTTVDRTADDGVTVAVGAEGNNGNFAYDPPAVRVTPGTTVQWDWTGEGSAHNVVSPEDGPLDSGDAVDAEGVQFEYTFEEPGIYRYVCTPHEGLGMKGAVVVGGPLDGGGDGGDGGDRGPAETVGVGAGGGAVFLAFAAPLLYALYARSRGDPVAAGADGEAATPTGEPPVTEEAPVEEPAVEIGHDEYDPWGTAALIAVYFAILVLMWVFMYFVEFLGRVSVMG